MNSEETIERAYELVSPISYEYNALSEIYYIVIKEDEDDEGEETGSLESFCEKCIESAIVEYKAKYPEEVEGKIVDYRYYNASGSERDGFSLCDKCGEHFDTCLLLDDQELEHWEEYKLNDIDIDDPRECYELSNIFNRSWMYGGQKESKILEKELRVLEIAKIVIDLFEKQHQT